MLKAVKDTVEVDWIGEDYISPLFRGERRLASLVEEILVNSFPGSAGLVPGSKSFVDFE